MSESQNKLAFVLFKYFPYGGLQRDFMRIANIALSKGDIVDVYTLEWDGDIPTNMNVHVVDIHAISNHSKYEKFVAAIKPSLNDGRYDCVIGFNKTPNLDVYFAADPCYEARVRKLRGFWVRWTRRYRHFSTFEKSVFEESSNAEILLIADAEAKNFKQYYGTPDSRMHLLPPGIQRDRLRTDDHDMVASNMRKELAISEDELFILMVGSGFRTKGLDRALEAIASLPSLLKNKIRLIAIGKDNSQPFIKMAEKLGLAKQTQFFDGRDDIPRFLAAADMLIHPAYSEAAGSVLIEALAAGLPVLTTDVCGYAKYINESQGGIVLQSPFIQSELNETLEKMLNDKSARDKWAEQGNHWAKQADIYDLHQHAYNVISKKIADKNATMKANIL